MKVLFVMGGTEMGGGTISFVKMIRGLHQKGVTCYVALPEKVMDPFFLQETRGCIEKFFYVPLVFSYHQDLTYYHGYLWMKNLVWNFVYCNPVRRRYAYAREARAMERVVAEVQPNLIHTNSTTMQAGHKIAEANGIPHVWHIREYQTKDFFFAIEPSYQALVQMLARDHAISITKDILSYFQLDHSSLARCIYNGCFSRKELVPAAFPKEDYFLCCSRISEEKGHREVVRAFAMFHPHHPTYRLVIAGFGHERFIQELQSFAKQARCLDAIDFVGFQKDVKPWMRKARALIVASRYEGFGRMTAEAAFCGCPVIGRNTGGTKEVLDITGGFPYLGDADALYRKMEEVAAYPEDACRTMMEHAQAEAVAHFSTEAYVDQVYEVYQDALSESICARGGVQQD